MRDVMRRVRPLLAWLLVAGCAGRNPAEAGTLPPHPAALALATDKATYAPGEPVVLSVSGTLPAGARVRYEHGDSVLADAPLAGGSWTWQPPTGDFRGYLAEVYTGAGAAESTAAAVAIDVSSTWARFPRYGFLSDFGDKTPAAIDAVIADLTRHHINGLQFYDWQYEHHRMVPDSAGYAPPTWINIGGDEVHRATVAGYIAAAHRRNMRAMFYDLVYGALKDAAADGVSDAWYLYTDPAHTTRDVLRLPQPPFVSDIFLLDPSNADWQQYLAREADRVYAALPFDGFHMDQVGPRGARYTATGAPVELASTFGSFITAMHAARPDKDAVMNAVNQYGQGSIAAAPTAFLYSEVWPPNESFADLAHVILQDDTLSGGRRNSVLAAYVNYALADQPGLFNTPSVLLADAVIFAFGGDHLELGDHMLGKEYFPNDNLLMRPDLQAALVPYYDFVVAYENLLRDGGSFDAPTVATSGALPVGGWPPAQGRVAVVGKHVGDSEVLHLLNFTDATTMRWRDDDGVQARPRDRTSIPLTVATDRQVARVWYATPDRDFGAPRALPFTQAGSTVSFTLPFLRYWSMVVLEYR